MFMNCTEWLKYFLNVNGKTDVCIIRKLRKRLGFTKADISYAKGALGVIIENNANAVHSATKWYWRLP